MKIRWAVIAVTACMMVGSSRSDEKDGWTVMFNGKDFSGWVIDGPKEFKDKADGNKMKPLWSVGDGTIKSTGNGFGFLRYDTKYDDFTFRVEYKLAKEKGANSGIGIRTMVFDPKRSTDTRPSFFSYEIQLLDDTQDKPHNHGTGSLYRYVAPSRNNHKPAPEWNQVQVECRGPNIKISFNGVETLSFDQSKDEKLKSKPLSGYICLQSHSKAVEFRNPQVKPIK